MTKAGRHLRTLAMAMAAGLAAAPASAALSKPEVSAWLAANTDMTAAQVAIAGPDRVYSLETLGPPTSAGEVVVLVRAETIAADPATPNAYASWDAHLLFDCLGKRLRAIRSAAYPRQNRKGAPKVEAASEGWTYPEAPEPAAQLLAAACDPAFAWPLRTVEARPAATPTPAAAPSAPMTVRLPQPTAVATPSTYAVQVARGPSEEGALRALKAARKTLGAASRELTDTTEVTRVGTARRYTVRLAGFRDEAAAKDACRALAAAGQACFPWQGGAEAPAAAAPAVTATATVAPKTVISGHAIQVARGPSEEGAQRALKAARKALGASAEGLSASTDLSHVGSRNRYTAVLSGFPTAADAARACETLTKAGQACFTLKGDTAD